MPNQYKTFIPAIPDDVLAPPPQPQPEPPMVRDNVDSTGAWYIVTLSISLFTVIAIVAMIVDGTAGRAAVTAGVKIFLGAMGLVVLVLSGALTDILRFWWHSRTERHRIDTWGDLAEQAIRWRVQVEENRALELQRDALPKELAGKMAAIETRLLELQVAAAPPQPPTWVTPYDNRGTPPVAMPEPTRDTTAEEAVRWVSSLYLDSGLPDPDKLRLSGDESVHGRVIGKVIGSKQGKNVGSTEALLWLRRRRVLLRRTGGYALNLRLVPTREDLRAIR